jgi:uncharacterized protein (DUF1800 family)
MENFGRPRVVRTMLAGCCTALLLSACGGGGADSAAPTPTAPPAAPAPVAITRAEAYRFLNQATFGATDAEAQKVIAQGYSAWIDAQIAQPASLELPVVSAAYAALTSPSTMVGSVNGDRVDAWFRNAVGGPDQLRQRVAFALSEIMVVSQNGALVNNVFSTADYYDMLARDAFGDFRALIQDVTLHPAMGIYLSMLGNQKANTALNIRPDENYARELMQLFTIGLVQLNPDGSAKLDAGGQPLPTYDQPTIEGFARVYTGWKWACSACSFAQSRMTLTPVNNQIVPMQAFADQHETGTKQLLSYPGAAVTTIPAGQTPALDLQNALDNIVNHPNVGPFVARALLQRLVTSNPSPAYIARISAKFDNDGGGRRGNLAAVVKAILLDAEARTLIATGATGADKQDKIKEPLLRLTQLWREYSGKATSARYAFANPATTFGQGPLQSGSVFNFFSPFYAPPGEIGTANLTAPELQIATEYIDTLVTNYFYQQAFCRTQAPIAGCGANNADTITIDTTAEIALAADPEALVSRIAERLLAGRISDTLKTEAKAQVARIAATTPNQRVAEALYLITTSPEFAQQR